MIRKESISISPVRILVVEDDMSLAEVYRETAEIAGNQATIASSPEEARQHVEQTEFDLIVTDGLEGKWYEVYEIGLERRIRTVVVSDNKYALESARSREIEALDKDLSSDNYQKIRSLFREGLSS